jgi:hypothetical protein
MTEMMTMGSIPSLPAVPQVTMSTMTDVGVQYATHDLMNAAAGSLDGVADRLTDISGGSWRPSRYATTVQPLIDGLAQADEHLAPIVRANVEGPERATVDAVRDYIGRLSTTFAKDVDDVVAQGTGWSKWSLAAPTNRADGLRQVAGMLRSAQVDANAGATQLFDAAELVRADRVHGAVTAASRLGGALAGGKVAALGAGGAGAIEGIVSLVRILT